MPTVGLLQLLGEGKPDGGHYVNDGPSSLDESLCTLYGMRLTLYAYRKKSRNMNMDPLYNTTQ